MVKRLFFVLVLCGIIPLCLVSCTKTESQQATGSATFDFSLWDLRQNLVSLSDYRGKYPVILFFWTTWCPYCREELLGLNERNPQLVEEGWQVFAIDVGESERRVRGYLENSPLILRVLLDEDRQASRSFKVIGVPTFIFLGKEAEILFKGHSFPEHDYREFIKH